MKTTFAIRSDSRPDLELDFDNGVLEVSVDGVKDDKYVRLTTRLTREDADQLRAWLALIYPQEPSP